MYPSNGLDYSYDPITHSVKLVANSNYYPADQLNQASYYSRLRVDIKPKCGMEIGNNAYTYDIYYKPKSPINKIFRIDRLDWDGKPYEFKCEKFKNIMIVSVEKDNS